MPWDGRDQLGMAQLLACQSQMLADYNQNMAIAQVQMLSGWGQQVANVRFVDPDTETIAADLGELAEEFRETDAWIATRVQMLPMLRR